MDKKFQLESYGYRGRWTAWIFDFQPIIRLSTVKLPENYGYETCIFYLGTRKSEVLEHYNTLEEAVDGHREYEREFRLTPMNFVL